MSPIVGLNEYQNATDTVAVYPGTDPAVSAGITDMIALELRDAIKSAGGVGDNEVTVGAAAILELLGVMRNSGLLYCSLGLAGEAGEVAEKAKKLIRDSRGVITEEIRQIIGKELGDVLWYVAQASRQIGYTLSDIATMNMTKLNDRKARGALGGSGDSR